MKVCETCGRELKNSEVFTANGIAQCHDCATEEIYRKVENIKAQNAKENSENRNVDNKKLIGSLISNSPNNWVKIMEAFTLVELIVLLISSFGGAIFVGAVFENGLLGFLSFFLFIIISIAAVGFQMIFVKLAEDVSILKNAVLKIVEKDN